MPSREPIEPLPAHLRRLRQSKQMSRSELSRATVGYDGRGLAEVTIKSIESGVRQPGIATLEAVAHGLEVAPEEFLEYRLAVARDQLDERVVGLDDAAKNLEAVEALLRKSARRRRNRGDQGKNDQ